MLPLCFILASGTNIVLRDTLYCHWEASAQSHPKLTRQLDHRNSHITPRHPTHSPCKEALVSVASNASARSHQWQHRPIIAQPPPHPQITKPCTISPWSRQICTKVNITSWLGPNVKVRFTFRHTATADLQIIFDQQYLNWRGTTCRESQIPQDDPRTWHQTKHRTCNASYWYHWQLLPRPQRRFQVIWHQTRSGAKWPYYTISAGYLCGAYAAYASMTFSASVGKEILLLDQ